MFGIIKKINTVVFKFKWRKNNTHNYTIPGVLFNAQQVTVGNKTYGILNINLGTNPTRTVQIGSFCSIAPDVQFIINPHNYKYFSSWGWQIHEYNERNYDWEQKTDIFIEDDVWIGQGAIVLGGAVLRQGCVIGAGSVVSREIPPYSIYAGGRVVKYRFSEEICRKLARIDYSKFTQDTINQIKGWHKIEIDETNVDNFLKLVPKK